VTCGGAPGGESGSYFSGGGQVAGIGRVLADLHLAPEPGVMFSCFLLLSNEVTHEVTQQLGASAVAALGG
jgi:hypothetical protein